MILDTTAAQTKEAEYLEAADRLAACLVWGVGGAWSEWRHASLTAQKVDQSAATPAVAKAMKKLAPRTGATWNTGRSSQG
jgi:hypothetical protein